MLPTPPRRLLRRLPACLAAALIVLLGACGGKDSGGDQAGRTGSTQPDSATAGARPALSVRLVTAQSANWPRQITLSGDVVAWQEAVIGAEISQHRLTDVRAQVGDVVRKGQVLALIDDAAIKNEVAEARAAVAELTATAAEARANAGRASELRARGFYSAQMNAQYQTTAQSAGARLDAARARLEAALLRQEKTRVVAPDDGVISARQAAVGSLAQPGEPLFKLIRDGRLEWRAEAPADDLARLRPGQAAEIGGPSGTVRGLVRQVAPAIDPKTRNGLVYVDLPAAAVETGGLRAGMFARGGITLGETTALHLPQSAVVLREGFAAVFTVDGEGRARLKKVTPGRRQGERIEIVEGLAANEAVIEQGGGFLADGDRVAVAAGNP